MEKTKQINKITKILDILHGETNEDAFRMLEEASDYVMGRTDLFPHQLNYRRLKMKCIDCGKTTESFDNVCDRCDFKRNYPELSDAEVDKMFNKIGGNR